jgi:HD superfamily phosphodiesterase
MNLERRDFGRAVEARFPGLVGRIEALVNESESKFSGAEGGFLWEHSVLVASLAFRLAENEGVRPWVAALAALLHDSGKFAGGLYHEDERPEEEGSAEAARRLLEEAGAGKGVVDEVRRGLAALYRSGGRRNRLADVLHDADFLSKSGALGVANFFVKSALRGRNLERMVMDSLSKEMTYAAALPLNMRTKSGRELAAKKGKDTLRFHRAFLREFGAASGLDFVVKRFGVPFAKGPRRRAGVFVVMPRRCGTCGRTWAVGLRTEKGVKCERLEADLRCPSCGLVHTVSFCLPELGGCLG